MLSGRWFSETRIVDSDYAHSYAAMRKAELEVALDDHLRANQTTYQNDPSLSDYYKRLNPSSPAKRASSMVKSEAPEKRAARRKTKTAEDADAT